MHCVRVDFMNWIFFFITWMPHRCRRQLTRGEICGKKKSPMPPLKNPSVIDPVMKINVHENKAPSNATSIGASLVIEIQYKKGGNIAIDLDVKNTWQECFLA